MNPGLNHIPIMPSNVRFWGEGGYHVNRQRCLLWAQTSKKCSRRGNWQCRYWTPAIQVSLPRHSPATAADARKEPQQRGGAVRVGKQGVTGITFLSISRYRSQGVWTASHMECERRLKWFGMVSEWREAAMPKYAQEICGPTLTVSALALFLVLAVLIPAWQPSGPLDNSAPNTERGTQEVLHPNVFTLSAVCPLKVISGQNGRSDRYPLYPRKHVRCKRECPLRAEADSAVHEPMSALLPISESCTALAHVRFGPIADITNSGFGFILSGP